MRMGRLPDDRSLHARFLAALQFLNRLIDVVDRDGRDAEQTFR